MWVVSVPLAFVLSRYTSMYVVWIYAALSAAEWIKCALGFYLVKKGVWINNIVS